jgi:hypothetical protein
MAHFPFCWHDWSAWSAPRRKTGRVVQNRICHKCGKRQQNDYGIYTNPLD